MPDQPTLGVCYYPEHWDRTGWADDAARMRDLGIRFVRIGEFAWSVIEPRPGAFEWGWLDEAIETLAAAGLQVILGTPTATPPKWLVDRSPEILPVDREGRTRRFGSRRHYCFSSPVYRAESRRITRAIAERYGRHDAVAGWQTDNEYGCHDTVLSYSDAACAGFRRFLADRYGTIDALNEAWGNRFWSMPYDDWDDIDLPNLTVTEANPSHWLDFHRFASSEVDAFNREQVAIIKELSPGRPVTHNFMGQFVDFDAFATGEALDFASWDSYPLGHTERADLPDEVKLRYGQTGHPDMSALHHDLYRGVGRGRFWVMEQQPGPVNWADWNPSPRPGMVRLWTWEAIAHGAEVVSYFRWRQAPFAQEQMHAGLNRPDGSLDAGGTEAAQVAAELDSLQLPANEPGDLALVFDYEAAWTARIQPQGADFVYFDLVYRWYTAMRRLGLNVDIVPQGATLDPYRAVFVPSLPIVHDDAIAAFQAYNGPILFGPRSGSKTASFQIPANLPPGPLSRLLPVRVTRVESLRPGLERGVRLGNRLYPARRWVEHLESDLPTAAEYVDGSPAMVENQGRFYLGFWPDRTCLNALVDLVARRAGLGTERIAEGVRVRRRGNLHFCFNYGPDAVEAPAPAGAEFALGQRQVPPFDLAAWRS